MSEYCDSCGSEGPTRYSPDHAARFCAECWARENGSAPAQPQLVPVTFDEAIRPAKKKEDE